MGFLLVFFLALVFRFVDCWSLIEVVGVVMGCLSSSGCGGYDVDGGGVLVFVWWSLGCFVIGWVVFFWDVVCFLFGVCICVRVVIFFFGVFVGCFVGLFLWLVLVGVGIGRVLVCCVWFVFCIVVWCWGVVFVV